MRRLMHSITLNQNWKKVRVTLDPPQKGPSRKGNEPIPVYLGKSCCEAAVYILYGYILILIQYPGILYSTVLHTYGT